MSDEKIEITFKELSSVCEGRVPTGSWFDNDERPEWDWTCVGFNIDSETPSLPELGKEKECNQENCPLWKRFRKKPTFNEE